MNAPSSHHHGSKTDVDSWSQFRPYIIAAVIVVAGICVGYIAVRCLDNREPKLTSREVGNRNSSSRRNDSGGNTSSRIHNLKLHAQSPFDDIVEDLDDDESEEDEEEEYEYDSR